MAEVNYWYLTPITRSGSNAPNWDVDPSQSVQYEVWFGTQAEYNALPDPGIYDIVIVDVNSDGLVSATEMRDALNGSTAPNPSNNQGYLGEYEVDYDGTGPQPTVAYSTSNQGIQSTTQAMLLTIDPLDPNLTDFPANYKGGVGNFDPFDPGTLAPPCFVHGTHILTPEGQVRVADLCVGDLVMTRDHGPQPVRWIGVAQVSAARLTLQPELYPVVIRQGALGENRPAADLHVSRQHRVLVDDWRAELMFGADDGVLVPAIALCNDSTVTVDHAPQTVTYYHVAFDRHEVIWSEGLETESFFPAARTVQAMTAAQRNELFTLYPELATNGQAFEAARPQPATRGARMLARA
ncbi:Hint domain-containing protein [Pukyongiella litopenaei]|uniref:Hint domain-containing protein n=1 Tax=Pukyongiella litopenaei TaxID=2605946 RepID=A0A2S0MR62_9RHOB|nr:Hint domain-containing protein [Pukyongiella litopenaei]AVO38183.1 Hint domain-containing protein [Pukyongiella litopenaei]